jgi:hypothetical protein
MEMEGIYLWDREWRRIENPNFPQQASESVDCEIYPVKGMEELAVQGQVTFKSEDIKQIRACIASDIIMCSTKGGSPRKTNLCIEE